MNLQERKEKHWEAYKAVISGVDFKEYAEWAWRGLFAQALDAADAALQAFEERWKGEEK